MTIQDEAFARYHDTHEGHVNPQGAVRDEWALDFFRAYFLPHFPTTIQGHEVLDIGCGDGAMMRAFEKMGFAVMGTDLDPKNCGKKKRVALFDVLKHPLKWKFDYIVLMGIIEHIRKDELLSSLRNIRKMLKPGGTVFVTTQNMDSLMGDHFRYLDITHELGFTRESLCQVARLAGFLEVSAYPFMSTPPKRERGLKGLVKRLWREAYRYHVRVVDPVRYSTWWEADGLLGVWR